MKKEELGVGQYVATSTCYFEGRINPIKEKIQLTDKVEKLKGKLDRASKRYGELIKIIGDKAIKSI